MVADDPFRLKPEDFDDAIGKCPYQRHTLRPEDFRLFKHRVRFYWLYELVDRIKMLIKSDLSRWLKI